MVKLSYSSLNNLHNGHEWINKQLGIPVPEYPFLREGTEAHRLIQNHVSGVSKHPFLSHIEITFPIVEVKSFDENCKFTFNVPGGYEIRGYVDGKDPEKGRLLEIKTSDTGWSIGQFMKSYQRKLYALAHPKFTEAYLITGNKDPNRWDKEPPKLYSIPLTQKDRDEALRWISDGVKILLSGDFKGGLDENGKCTGCFWNMPRYRDIANCHFL